MPKSLHDCDFYTIRTDDGHHIGRCKEWPDLHTRPTRNRLDAIDDIISIVRDKLAHIHAKAPIPAKPQAGQEANSGG